MQSERSFVSETRFGNSALRGKIRSGRFIRTVASTAHNRIEKDPDEESSGRQAYPNSEDDLMARFSHSRSIRAGGLEDKRALRSLHAIRKQSINYLFRQLFGRNNWISNDPLSALFADYTNPGADSSFGLSGYRYSYAEVEQTGFSTEGTVVTASGKEINFQTGFTMSRSFYEEVSQKVDLNATRMIDPLVINLDCDVASVSDQKFYFDLDADGHAEEISRLNAGSGFLALDKNNDGVINDGSELFGTQSGNGFADLAQYDQDGNGWIDEADEIFDKLLIWQKDENGKDVLRGLGAAGVGAIYLGNVASQFAFNSAENNQTNAVVRQSGAFLYENGTAGTIQQIDFAR